MDNQIPPEWRTLAEEVEKKKEQVRPKTQEEKDKEEYEKRRQEDKSFRSLWVIMISEFIKTQLLRKTCYKQKHVYYLTLLEKLATYTDAGSALKTAMNVVSNPDGSNPLRDFEMLPEAFDELEEVTSLLKQEIYELISWIQEAGEALEMSNRSEVRDL